MSCRWFYDQDEVVPIGTGESAGSEIETQLIIDLVQKIKPATILTIHGPIGCIDDPAPTLGGQWLAEQTSLPLVKDIGYPTPGSMGTWAAENEIDIVTWEFPCESVEALAASQTPILIEIIRGRSPFSETNYLV